ncbi:MAG: hypothetical protein HY903_05040 [Deltaproteobacteria bacterium]|nr:hypothetical protein [Deltaproteobacteria bacterium]
MVALAISLTLVLSSDPSPPAVPAKGAAAAAAAKLVVMPLRFSELPEAAVGTLNELLANSVRRLGKYEVIGRSDIDAMLGLENLKDQLGCDDVTCAAEIGGALGAELLLAGQVAHLGDSIIIVLKLIDTKQQKVLGSAKHKAANDENTYDEAVEDAVLQLFGVKAPAPGPSKMPESQDMLRALITDSDWQRYQSDRSTSGRDVPLSTWVNEQNRESTLLFVAELAAGGMALISAGATSDREPHVGGAPLFGATGLFGLAALLLVDVLDFGSVSVTGQ